MSDMPTRDITGECTGECRDRVYEGETQRQSEIDALKMDYDTPTPSVKWANERDVPPGALGGHV